MQIRISASAKKNQIIIFATEMMQMPGSKTKPDGSVPLVTEDYKMRHSERKK